MVGIGNIARHAGAYKRHVATGLLLLGMLAANAGEFWMEPKKFRYHAGEAMTVDFMEDENFNTELSGIKKGAVEQLHWHSVTGMIDVVKEVKPTRGGNLVLNLTKDGTQLFTMRSSSDTKMDRAAFETYLKESGNDDALELLRRSSANEPVRDHRVRYAKVFVQVGDQTDEAYKRRTGLRIDIIPDKNPYDLKPGDYLQCLVLYNGKPLPHALVNVWGRRKLTTFLQSIYTENDGTIRFPISTRGVWMVSTVKVILSEQAGADWQSFYGNLVFGI